jgi:large subunit ribosomal protein L19
MFTTLLFLLVLTIVVLVHEAGHFFVAKWSGMKVYEFGWGFPPRAFGFYKDPKTKKITGKKERIQIFEGLVIARKGGNGTNATFMVRKISYGVGVERIFPLHSPNIVKLEVVKNPSVSKAKLYYVRGRQDNLPRVRKNQGEKKVAKK